MPVLPGIWQFWGTLYRSEASIFAHAGYNSLLLVSVCHALAASLCRTTCERWECLLLQHELPGCFTAPGLHHTDVPSLWASQREGFAHCRMNLSQTDLKTSWGLYKKWQTGYSWSSSPSKWQRTPQCFSTGRLNTLILKENPGKSCSVAKDLAEKCLSSGEQLLIMTAHLHLTAIPTTLKGLCLFQMVTGCIRDQREARATKAPR